MRAKVVTAAAALLEAAEADIEIEDGQVFVRGAPGHRRCRWRAWSRPPSRPSPSPAWPPPDFDATSYHHVPTVTYASAVHVAQVEVDPETGAVRLLRYVVAHDCGTVINPMIVEGQVHGGVAQGVGGGALRGHRLRRDGPAPVGHADGLRGARAPTTCR